MATPTGEQQRIEPDYPKDRTKLGGPRLGLVGWLRWIWRQLTSMRTALALLLLLAVAAIPGSIWPQRSVDAVRVRTYFEENPDLAPWLDRLHLFDVYSSPWFAAIYLLLMISLLGCIAPRLRQHVASIRAQPPKVPGRLGRMPVHRQATLDATPAEVVAAARAALGDKRFRLRAEDGDTLAVSAEKGYLKETGNLVFHLALFGIIVAVAAGSLFGWRGEIIIKEGESWTADAGTFDTLNLGPLVDELDIPSFTVTLETLNVEFESQSEGAQFGQPRRFDGVAVVEVPGQETERQDFGVNNPLSVDGDSIFLLGNGYAPVVTVRDPAGEILFSDAVTFLPQDNNYGSDGAIKVPGRDPGLGLVGGFLPTLAMDAERGMTSSFPGPADPALVLTAYEGELYPEGRAQSVFSVDTESMEQMMLPSEDPDVEEPVAFILRPGESYDLPDGTVVEFEGLIRWGGLLVRHDPGRMPALWISMITLVGLGLMLGVKRRRVYVRVAPGDPAADPSADSVETGGQRHTVIDVAGLPKGTDPGLEGVVEDVLARITQAVAPHRISTTAEPLATEQTTKDKDQR